MKKRRSKTSKRLQKQRRQENDFFKVVEKQIEGMRALCRPKTVYNCQTALRAFRRYLKEEMPCYKDRLPLRILTLQLIAGFERHLIERGVSLNTSHAYMRSLRSLVNRARSRGYACRDNLFALVGTGVMRVTKRSLSEDDMRRLCHAKVKPGSLEEQTRDCAVFSYLAGGVPFCDVVRLSAGSYDAQTGELSRRRHKTGVPITVCLTPEAKNIWLKSREDPDSFIGRLAGKGKAEQELLYQGLLAKYNRSLKELAGRCGITSTLTSYTIRHTFATVAHNRYDADLKVLSMTLGHHSEQTTCIYVSQVDSGAAYKVQEKMEEGIFGERK